MSDDRKRSARLQGRFSDPKENRHCRRNKHNQNPSENNEENQKGQASKSRTAEGINVEYQADSKHFFKELSDAGKFKEIRAGGTHEISSTVNGTSRLIYEPSFFSEVEADELFIILKDATTWYDKNIVIRGQEYPQPRLVSWYGPYPYSYSGTTLEPASMPSAIIRIKERVETFLRMHDLHVNFNSVLLNRYRTGKDSVAWHSDDEMTMGVQPTIASVSLGEVRSFQMRPSPKSQVENLDPETRLQVNLLHGSLLIMDGCMQKDWQHQVPKEYHDKGERINLTFRTVYLLPDISTEVPYSTKESTESYSNSEASQPKPVYNSDNFPSLSQANNPKSNISNKTNSEKQFSSSRQTDSTIGNSKAAIGKESAKDPIENDRNPVTNASSSSGESTLNELVNYANAKDDAETKSSEVGSPFLEDEDENSFKNNFEDTDDAAGTEKKKHKLNVNAPDFVPIGGFPDVVQPSTSFKDSTLRELSDFFSKSNSEVCVKDDFVISLVKELQFQRNKDYFLNRDWLELEVYIKLIEGGESEVNQRVINERIFTIVNNTYKFHNRKHMPQRNPRGRGNFRGNSYRPH